MNCKSEYCQQIITNNNIKKYDGYCQFCFAHLYPDDERSLFITRKSKELKVVTYLLNIFNDFIYDKPFYVDLEGGCCATKRRIDLRKLINNTMLCIEIDENQHKYYIKQNDNDRYNDLFVDFSGKYIFIRYNPDKYKNKQNKYQDLEFEKRMKILVNIINLLIIRINNEMNDELIEIYNIFYDDTKNDNINELNDLLHDDLTSCNLYDKYDILLNLSTKDNNKLEEINTKIKQKKSETMICEYCNKEICVASKNKHEKSKTCIKNRLNEIEIIYYSCKYCNYKFDQKSNKDNHEKNMLCRAKDIYLNLQLEIKHKNKLLEEKDKEIELKDLENNDLKEQNKIIILNLKPRNNKCLLILTMLSLLMILMLFIHMMIK